MAVEYSATVKSKLYKHQFANKYKYQMAGKYEYGVNKYENVYVKKFEREFANRPEYLRQKEERKKPENKYYFLEDKVDERRPYQMYQDSLRYHATSPYSPLNRADDNTYQKYNDYKNYDEESDKYKKRGFFNRLFDVLNVGQFTVQGALRGLADPTLDPIQGAIQGFKAGNPFGKGHEEWEYQFKDTLKMIDKNPDSKKGNLLRGAVGLIGDIFLDPLTYVSGGLSGLIKGSGKHSVKVATRGAKFVDGMGDSVKYLDTLADINKNVGLTQEVAEGLVRNSNLFKSGKVTLDVAEEAGDLVRRFNKLIGVNVSDASKTFSLANAPFGKQLFGKYADKSTTLISSDVMKKVGDKTFAPIYAEVRGKLLGSKIGKLFSNDSVLYNVAKSNPNQVYNFMKVVDLDVGNSIDKLVKEKAIRNNAYILGNLTPKQQKEIILASEDSTLWSKVKQQIRFSNTEEASVLKTKIEASKIQTQGKIDAIEEYKRTQVAIQNNLSFNIADKNKALEALEMRHIENLATMNTRYVRELGMYDEVSDAIKKAETYLKNDAIDPNDLVKRFRGQETGVVDKKTLDELLSSERMLKSKSLVRPEGISNNLFYTTRNSLDDLGFREYKGKAWADKFVNKFDGFGVEEVNGRFRVSPIDKVVATDKLVSKVLKADNKPFEWLSYDDKAKYIDDMSVYIFGKKGFINHGTTADKIGEVVRMIENGTDLEHIALNIFENRMDFNGAGKAKWNFISETLGYDDWHSKYTVPLNEYAEKKKIYDNAVEKLSKQKGYDFDLLEELRQFDDGRSIKLESYTPPGEYIKLPEPPLYSKVMDLEQLNLKRELLKYEFKDATTLSEVEDIIRNFNEMKFNRSVDDVIESIQSKLSSTVKGDNRDAWNVELYLDEWKKGARREFQKSPDYGKVSSSFEVEDEMFELLTDKYKLKITDKEADFRFFESFKRDANTIAEKRGLDLVDINKYDRESIYSEAYSRTFGRWRKGEFHSPDVIRLRMTGIRDERVKNTILNHKLIQDSVKPTHKITFRSSNGEKLSGVVERVKYVDGVKRLEVNVDGKYMTITKDKVLARVGRIAPRNLDELRNSSEMFDSFVNKQAETYKHIGEVIDNTVVKWGNIPAVDNKKLEHIKGLQNSYNNTVDTLNKELLLLERDLVLSKEGVEKVNPSMFIQKHQNRINIIDDALNNSSAFESYIKINFGTTNEYIDDIVKKYNPNLGEYVLKPNHGLDDDIADVVELVRKEFKSIADSEVSIGKLKQVQIDEMVNRYMPHILTDEGSKLFQSNEMNKYIKQFGGEFGYGREYNQFAKSRTIKQLVIDGEVIKNPSIPQINEYFAKAFPSLNGKNVMSEDLANIYVTRALKNSKLMYDNKYMEGMLDIFGEAYDGKLVEGFTAITNYGQMSKYVEQIVSHNTSLDVSEHVSDHLANGSYKFPVGTPQDVIDSYGNIGVMDFINSEASKIYKSNIKYSHLDSEVAIDGITSDLLSNYIDRYFKEVFTEDVRSKWRVKNLESFLRDTDTVGILDDVSLPLPELSGLQIKSITNNLESLNDRYLENIRMSYGKFSKAGIKPESVIWDMSIDDIMVELDKAIRGGEEAVANRAIKIVEKIDKMNGLSSLNVKNMNNAIVSKANQARKLQIVKDNNNLLQMYDKFTHFMKLNQTAVSPAFHTRNKLSNMFNNWLAVGQDALNVDFQKQAFSAMRGKNKDATLEVTTRAGKKIQVLWSDVVARAEVNGVIDAGIFATEAGANNASKGIMGNLFGGKLDPTNTSDFLGYTYGTKAGSIIENHDRLIHYASQIKNGMSWKEAGESVNKYLFDYGDLTMFEQSVMKRIFPFYTWIRKNGALQLETLLEQPEKYRHIGKVIGGIENMVDKDDRMDKNLIADFAQSWVQTPLNVINPEGRKEPVLWNPNLPFQDLEDLPNPFDLKGTAKEAFVRSNPIFKIPAELAMNKNVFFESDIVNEEDSSEEKFKKRASHVAHQFAITPIVKGLREKKGTDLALHTLNNTSGIKMISYDYEKYSNYKKYSNIESYYADEEKKKRRHEAIKNISNGFKGTFTNNFGKTDFERSKSSELELKRNLINKRMGR